MIIWVTEMTLGGLGGLYKVRTGYPVVRMGMALGQGVGGKRPGRVRGKLYTGYRIQAVENRG